MAQGFCFVCDKCDHAIVAWDDGNPYYIDDDGKKKYAYHPNHELLERCIVTMPNTSACPAGRNLWWIPKPRSRRVRNVTPVKACARCSWPESPVPTVRTGCSVLTRAFMSYRDCCV